MNCHQCKFRCSIPGDAHSKCNHPVTKDIHDNPLLRIMGIFASVGRVPPIILAPQILDALEELDITLNAHGVENNWANWPINYDEIWVNQCKGFEKKP